MYGAQEIQNERAEQLTKHFISVKDDVENNDGHQLLTGAMGILISNHLPPAGWSRSRWQKMIDKPYRDRLIIAGALIAAEIDRLDTLKELENSK